MRQGLSWQLSSPKEVCLWTRSVRPLFGKSAASCATTTFCLASIHDVALLKTLLARISSDMLRSQLSRTLAVKALAWMRKKQQAQMESRRIPKKSPRQQLCSTAKATRRQKILQSPLKTLMPSGSKRSSTGRSRPTGDAKPRSSSSTLRP